jgi:hypothetical protein
MLWPASGSDVRSGQRCRAAVSLLAVLWRRRSGDSPRADWRVALPDRNTADDEVVWRAIERIFAELRTPYEPDERLSDLTDGQRAVYSLDWIRKEFANGGFDQLFGNSTGYLTPEAIEGADYIGANDYADILRRAAALFPGGVVPRDRDARTDFIDSGDYVETLERLDEEFFALLDDPERNLTTLMAIYMATHKDEFFIRA